MEFMEVQGRQEGRPSHLSRNHARFHDERCEMSVRNGHLAIVLHANVAVTNGHFTPIVVEMPSYKLRKTPPHSHVSQSATDDWLSC